jgi:hypothetical protein
MTVLRHMQLSRFSKPNSIIDTSSAYPLAKEGSTSSRDGARITICIHNL